MTILYIFQIKSLSKKAKNAVKRRFYYNFKKISNHIKLKLFSKSQMIVVDEANQNEIDLFFKDYTDWIDYYKITVERMDFVTKNKKA